jgi:hypothetical protein
MRYVLSPSEVDRLKWDHCGPLYHLSKGSRSPRWRPSSRTEALLGDAVSFAERESGKRYCFTHGDVMEPGPNGYATHLRFVRVWPTA